MCINEVIEAADKGDPFPENFEMCDPNTCGPCDLFSELAHVRKEGFGRPQALMIVVNMLNVLYMDVGAPIEILVKDPDAKPPGPDDSVH